MPLEPPLRLRRLAAACLLVAAISLPAAAQEWPRLRAPSDDARCAKALAIAKATFLSPQGVLYTVNSAPPETGLDVVARADGHFVAGVHISAVDASVLEPIPDPVEYKRHVLHWQRTPSHGLRFVLSEVPFGWQGNWYELHTVREDVTPDALRKDIQDQYDDVYKPVLDNEWRPPLIVRDQSTSEVWAIALGHPANILYDWKVISIGADGARERCAIQFAPDIAPPKRVGKAWDYLPEPTRQLAMLLDGTLGTGHNEGTANPTQRNRNAAAHGWANAGRRPWVFTGQDASANRANVTSLLTGWSTQNRSFASHYRKIVAQYPLAQAALRDHYRNTFGMSERDAEATARAAIDTAASCNFSMGDCYRESPPTP